ncbi:MAG: riboflavin synthase [Planctomycetota bacterium]|jgi:riboflavin synthase|nr:riboflavin synthase [Planctomycetota bacterium]
MFTGIVEASGPIQAVTLIAGGCRLSLALGALAEGTRIGDSICVSGACLTVTTLSGDQATFDVSAETLRKTTMGAWRTGTVVNLERALAVGDRLGGHMVSGHVDGVGRVVERRKEGDSERFTFVLPDDGSVKVIEKGSVTIDGTSLTTWDCRGARFSVAVIPHTLSATTLGALRAGDRVNMEQDLIGRWIERIVADR